MYEDSRSYIGKPDNVAPNATNDALINIYGTATRSNLKLDNAPSTENQLNAASRPGVDYNHLTPAYIDVNGHVVKPMTPIPRLLRLPILMAAILYPIQRQE